jgi:hypothetical protein
MPLAPDQINIGFDTQTVELIDRWMHKQHIVKFSRRQAARALVRLGLRHYNKEMYQQEQQQAADEATDGLSISDRSVLKATQEFVARHSQTSGD